MSAAAGEKLRVAVVGCGAIAAFHHLPAIAERARSGDLELALLVDRDRDRAAALARRFGVTAIESDWRAVAGRADAAIICLPNHLHRPAAVDLLGAGLAVLVEKPMALSAAEADAMIAAARSSAKPLAVGLEFRFFDASRAVGDLLRSGLLGAIRRVDMRVGVVSRWPFATDFALRRETAGGGVVADFGTHVLDLLLWWLGDWELLRYRDDAQGGIEADALLELRLGGAAATVELSRTRNLRNTCRIEGERATLEVGVWDPDPELRLHGAAGLDLAGHARRRGEGGMDFAESFRRQLADFIAAVRGERPPFVPGAEGRRALARIDACYARRELWELPWTLRPRAVER